MLRKLIFYFLEDCNWNFFYSVEAKKRLRTFEKPKKIESRFLLLWADKWQREKLKLNPMHRCLFSLLMPIFTWQNHLSMDISHGIQESKKLYLIENTSRKMGLLVWRKNRAHTPIVYLVFSLYKYHPLLCYFFVTAPSPELSLLLILFALLHITMDIFIPEEYVMQRRKEKRAAGKRLEDQSRKRIVIEEEKFRPPLFRMENELSMANAGLTTENLVLSCFSA